MFVVKSVPVVVTTTILSGFIALSLVLRIHKMYDPLPPARDPGLPKTHMMNEMNTLTTWG